jgi:hypothetical protein
MTKYKLTEKAIAEKFDMLSGFTINMINLRVNELIEERVNNGAPISVPDCMIVEISRILVTFKDPDMNKLFSILDTYKFLVYSEDLEEEEEEFPKELKKITTGVWYDVEDIINGEYDIEDALEDTYDVMVCETSAYNMGYKGNFTGSHGAYHVGYLDRNDNVYVLCSHGQKFPLKAFVRLMFIPAETKEE